MYVCVRRVCVHTRDVHREAQSEACGRRSRARESDNAIDAISPDASERVRKRCIKLLYYVVHVIFVQAMWCIGLKAMVTANRRLISAPLSAPSLSSHITESRYARVAVSSSAPYDACVPPSASSSGS